MAENSTPVKFSIIIPVYNVEFYLMEWLESILVQTFQYYKVRLFNDGSSDRSGEICGSFSENDSRITVFLQLNTGVSAARNLGIEKAKGKWLAFIDSDDYV